MDDYYRNKEAEESEPVDSGDLLMQLREKLKTQAQRIRSLETYKVLCEERISELHPSHPLPVLPEHIGSGGASVSLELLNSKQKIAKLEQQISQTTEMVPGPSTSVTYNKLHELYTLLHQKYNAMVKDKNELEESLRNEVLASEEQRAYIEVLKQAIEIKIESFGLKGIKTEEFAELSQMKNNTDESRRETSRMNMRILDYESQFKSLTESLKIKNNECKDLAYERDELTDQLHQAAEALQYAEEEVQKLEEEKSNLIDYVDRQGRVEQDYNNEIKELKNRLGNVQEENKKSIKQVHSLTEENKKISNELELIKIEFNRNEKTLKETQQSFINLKARIEEKDRTLQKYKEENNNVSIQNSSLQAENITLADTLGKVENELKANKSDLDISRIEEDKIKENLSYFRTHSQQLQEEKVKIEKNYLEADHKMQNLQSDLTELLEKYENLQKTFQNSQTELNKLKDSVKISQDSEDTLTQINFDLKRQNLQLQTELDSLLKRHQSINNELFSIKEEYEQEKLKLVSLNQENNSLQVKIHEVYSLLDSEKQNFRAIQEEKKKLKDHLEELNNTVEYANESFHERDNQYRSAELEINSLSQLLSQIQNELVQEKYNKTTQYEELCIINTENEKLKRELNNFKEFYELACRLARNSASYLSPINNLKFKESAL